MSCGVRSGSILIPHAFWVRPCLVPTETLLSHLFFRFAMSEPDAEASIDMPRA